MSAVGRTIVFWHPPPPPSLGCVRTKHGHTDMDFFRSSVKAKPFTQNTVRHGSCAISGKVPSKQVIKLNFWKDQYLSLLCTRKTHTGDIEQFQPQMLKQRHPLDVTIQFKIDTLKKLWDWLHKSVLWPQKTIKSTYYSGPVCSEHRKPLIFSWGRHSRQYECLTNGTAMAPHKF